MHRMSQSKQLWPVGCMSLEESTCMWMLSLFVLIFRRRVSYWLIISHCRRSWRNRVVTDTSRRCVCVLCCSVVLYTCRLSFICISLLLPLSSLLPPPLSSSSFFFSFLSFSLFVGIHWATGGWTLWKEKMARFFEKRCWIDQRVSSIQYTESQEWLWEVVNFS